MDQVWWDAMGLLGWLLGWLRRCSSLSILNHSLNILQEVKIYNKKNPPHPKR
jgi:hypothetical protein